MIDRDTALAKAKEHLASTTRKDGPEMVIVEGETIEDPQGWVFFIQSTRYLETKAPVHRLVGNSPIFVDREGKVSRVPTYLPASSFLAERSRKD